MERCRGLRSLAFVLSLLGLVIDAPIVSHAGGLTLYEIGTADVGLASAGWAARAHDPATLLKNPAGMSRLQGNQFQGGLQLLYASIGFTPGAGTTVSGNNGGNPIGLLPGASMFYVHGLGQDFKVGLGLFSNFGAVMNYEAGWVGRYYAIENTLIGVSIMPGLSYRINEYLSIGAAANVMHGHLNYSVAINNAFNVPDGEMQTKDSTWGAGGNVGLLYEPRKGTRLGVTYYSQVKLNFSDTPTFTGLGPIGTQLQNRGLLNNELDLGMTVPQSVMVSAYHRFAERWALMLDFGWQQWSQFGKVDIGVVGSGGTLSTTATIDYRDTYHGAVGIRYRLNPAWLINTGFAYDSSMVSDQNRTVTVPIGEAFRFGLGAEWKASPQFNVAFSYELAYGGDLPVNQNRGPLAGAVVGQYPGTYFNFFQISVIWGSAKGQKAASPG